MKISSKNPVVANAMKAVNAVDAADRYESGIGQEVDRVILILRAAKGRLSKAIPIIQGMKSNDIGVRDRLQRDVEMVAAMEKSIKLLETANDD